MSTFRLLFLALAESRALVGDLLRLAKAEIKAQIAKLGLGLGFALSAVALLLLAIPFLLLGVVELLIAKGIAAYVAFFAAGGILVLIALILGIVAAVSLRGLSFVPERTIAQVKRIKSDTL